MSTSSTAILTLIANTAAQYGVDPNLATEVAYQESNLNQNAVSSAGAIGVMQLMPATAKALGVDPTNLQQNIQGGCMLLAQLLTEFNGDEASALAAYNWNPTSVKAAQAANPSNWLASAPTETQNYVSTIMANLGTQYNVTAAIPGVTTTAAPTENAQVLESGVSGNILSQPQVSSPYTAIAWVVGIGLFVWAAFLSD